MDSEFTHVGVAVARAGEYQIYLTEVFARVFDEASLAEIVVLYTELAPDALPHDEPNYGEVADETLRIGPPTEDNPEFWTQRGIDAFIARRFAEAIDLFNRSLEINPDYEYAHYNLARAYIAHGEPDRALPILQRQVTRAPDDADAWNSTGAALLLLQRFDEAVAAFQQVLRLRARDAGSWYNLGLAHEMQGNLDTAERAYRQALLVEPDLAVAAAALARVTR
jgi:tetratricopeptide (TPR) repeat protein